MFVEIVRAHGDLFAIVEHQNEITGTWKYSMRKVPKYNHASRKVITVDHQKLDITKDVEEFTRKEEEHGGIYYDYRHAGRDKRRYVH